MLLVAIACYVASRFIPSTGGEAPDLTIDSNIFRSTRDLLRELWSDKRLWRTGIMVSLFWMFGAIALSVLPPMIKMRMGGEEMVVSIYLSVFAISVATRLRARLLLLQRPHRAAARAHRHAGAGVLFGRTRTGASFHGPGDRATPRAANFFATRPPGASPSISRAWRPRAACCRCRASPPLSAWAPVEKRARIVAAINVLNAAFMVAGALAVALLQALGLGLDGVFALMAVTALISAVWMFARLPTNPMRDFLSHPVPLLLPARGQGPRQHRQGRPQRDHRAQSRQFPRRGARAVAARRDPVFAIDSSIAQRWWVKPFLRFMRAMPLDPTQADGDAHPHQCRARRRDADHLSRRPHHRHRQPDEGL